MKNRIKVIIMCVFALGIGGCQMTKNKEISNLSEEHMRLCRSKHTKNKQLCERTMEKIGDFEQDVNTYFKEKFKIDGFHLTSIQFPYGSFDHGGFHATFYHEQNQTLFITSVFDYIDGKYRIRNITNEKPENAGQAELASAIILSEFYKTLPITAIENDLEKVGLSTNQDKRLYYSFDTGRFFKKRNIVASRNNMIILPEQEQQAVIEQYQKKNKIDFEERYSKYLQNKVRVCGLTYAKDKEAISEIFNKYMLYRATHPEYRDLLEPRIYYYENTSDVIEKDISMYIDNEVEIHE